MSEPVVKFTKMSAGGNDFIVIDNVTVPGPDEVVRPDGDFIRRVCSRALSVGADGVILIEPPERPETHVRMIYHNADGGRAALCGNGVRCVARMVAVRRLAPAEGMVIETDVGPLSAGVDGDRASFQLPLGAPAVRPVSLMVEGSLDEVSRTFEGYLVTAGVPHLVIPVRDAHAMPARRFAEIAPKLRRHEDLGPGGANVDFVTVKDRGTLHIRCWERGVEAETLSSGSGCIAAALCMTTAGLADAPVTCVSRSGPRSTVALARTDDGGITATLSGDARIIYTGVLNPEALTGFEP